MFSVTTPAILFPATSLILLAYTAKLLHLAHLIRTIKVQFQQSKKPELLKEMENLKKRIYLIRNMQTFGVSCLFFCSVCMLMLFANLLDVARVCFNLSLLMLLCSLFLCFKEILISANALKIVLKGVKQ